MRRCVASVKGIRSGKPRHTNGQRAGRPLMERLEGRALLAAVDVLTQHNDLSRTGANLGETDLNVSNVNVGSFGRQYSREVDDQVYAQPLVATGVTVNGVKRNLLLVATVNDTVYAYDADNASAATPYWKASMLAAAHGAMPGARVVNNTDVGQNCGSYRDFSGNIGIVGTPVIDKSNGTIYLVARSVEGGKFVQRLHALDLATGAEKLGGPTVITASVAGTGDGSSNGRLPFDPQTENQRPGLALTGGKVIITWASHCDTGPYHGWVMAYDAKSLRQSWAFTNTPNGSAGGIWMSGAAPTVDAQGNIYVTSGNGSVNVSRQNYGGGIFKFSPTGELLDYFIPSNYQQTNNVDADFGSAGLLLVPGTDTLITGDKQGKLFVADDKNLTKLNRTDQILQEFQVTPTVNNDHIHGSPVYYADSSGSQWVYVWGINDKLKQFKFQGNKLASTTPSHTSNVTLAPTPAQPGGLLSISADGSRAGTGILWSMSTLGPSANQAVRPGILRAFDASDVSKELWNSQQDAARDDFGNLAKFNLATVSGGHVYVPTFSNQVVVYGLLDGALPVPGNFAAKPAAGKAQIDLSWAAVSGATNYVLERKVGNAGFAPLTTLGANARTFSDAAVAAGTNYTYRLRARNASGDGAAAVATASTAFTRDLAAYWKFDDRASGTGGTAIDSSGNGNTGTVGNAAAFTAAGQIADAIAFTSATAGNAFADSYVRAADSASLDPGSQITVAAWVKAADWQGNHRIVQKGANDDQYRLTAEFGKLKFDVAGVGTAATVNFPSTGVWHHIAGTFDGRQVRLYVDGQQVASQAGTSTNLSTTADPLYIGTKGVGGTPTDHMNGLIDEVRIYNYALPQGDISALVNGSAPDAPSALTATPTAPSAVNLRWVDNSTNETGFGVERRAGTTGAYVEIGTVAAGATAFTDDTLKPGTTYSYRVRALGAVGPSGYSNAAVTTTPSPTLNRLVARFAFGEVGGTLSRDYSGLGNNGTRVGGASSSNDSPSPGHSLALNGTTQWARIESSPSLEPDSAITLAAFVNADTWTGTRGIIAKGNREGSYYLAADQGVLKFNLSGQGTLTYKLPTTGVWHHVAGTYDGAAMKLYVDGELRASMAATGALDASGDPLFIGATAASGLTGQAFKGKIDDARIYNYAITARDVSEIYGNAARFPFAEKTGSTAADYSPNGNRITLVGGPAHVRSNAGSGLQFNGTNQYGVALDNQSLNPTGAITLAAYVNAETFQGGSILQKGVGSNVQYALSAANGRLSFQLGGVGTLTAAAPGTGAWHHVTATYDGSTMRLYADSKLIASQKASGAIRTGTDSLYLASAGPNNTPGTLYRGLLDGVYVFNRALTPGEIGELN